ncbi:MAG: fibronectin type III domain-containing protein [Planctomycetes bacterium]|nr:fibronectin type III domain-containing protein [Planctomycetota bacterium]
MKRNLILLYVVAYFLLTVSEPEWNISDPIFNFGIINEVTAHNAISDNFQGAVVVGSNFTGADSRFFSRRILYTSQLMPFDENLLLGTYSGPSDIPGVCMVPGGMVFCWKSRVDGVDSIIISRYDISLESKAWERVLSPDPDYNYSDPIIASRLNQLFDVVIVCKRKRVTSPNTEVVALSVMSSGDVGWIKILSNDPGNKDSLRLISNTFSNNHFISSWESDNGAPTKDIFFTVFDENGIVNPNFDATNGINVTGPNTSDETNYDIISGEQGIYLAYETDSGGDADIVAVKYDYTGSKIYSTNIGLSSDDGQHHPSIALKNDELFIAFDSNSDIAVQKIESSLDPDLSLPPAATICSAIGVQTAPLIKFNGAVFFVFWTDYRNEDENADIYCTLVGTDGSVVIDPVDGMGIAISGDAEVLISLIQSFDDVIAVFSYFGGISCQIVTNQSLAVFRPNPLNEIQGLYDSSSQQVTLEFTPNSTLSVSSYIFERSINYGESYAQIGVLNSSSPSASVFTDDLSTIIPGLTTQEILYRVITVSEVEVSGEALISYSIPSGEISVEIETNALFPPENISISTGPNHVRISWHWDYSEVGASLQTPSSFGVELSEDESFGSIIFSDESTEYVNDPLFLYQIIINELQPESTYFWRVRAIHDPVYSSWVQGTTVTLPDPGASPVVPPPQNFQATLNASNIQLSWSPYSANANGFVIERKIGSGSFQVITTINGTASSSSTTNIPPTPSCTTTAVSYRIKAFLNSSSGTIYSVPSNTSTVNVTAAGTLPPPANLELTPLSDSEIQIQWELQSGITSYTIKRSGTINGSYEVVSQIAGSNINYVDSGLLPDTTYFYTIQGFSSGNCSPEAGPVSATTFEEGANPKVPTPPVFFPDPPPPANSNLNPNPSSPQQSFSRTKKKPEPCFGSTRITEIKSPHNLSVTSLVLLIMILCIVKIWWHKNRGAGI